MRDRDIFNLIQPCKNRGLSFVKESDGSVTINGVNFLRMSDAERYLEGVQRND